MRRHRRGLGVLTGLLGLVALLVWALPALAGPGRGHHRVAAFGGGHTAGRTSGAGSLAAGLPVVSTVGSDARTKPKHPKHSPPPVDWAGLWSPPFSVMSPVAADLITPIAAVAGDDLATVASGLTDEDAPQTAHADLLSANREDVFAPRRPVPGAQQVLALASLGHREVLLDGSAADGESCCSSASALSESSTGSAGVVEPIVSGLEGTTTGALVPVRGGLLAVIDNQAGISVARSDDDGDFGAAEQLIADEVTPSLMAAAPLADGGAVVAWTAPSSTTPSLNPTTTTPAGTTTVAGYDQPQDDLIEFATDGPSGLPGAARLAVTVPANRWIDALQVVPHRSGATLAWTESWYQGTAYHSAVFWADLRSGAQVSRLSDGGTAAVGLSMAGSADGHEVLAWQACDVSAGSCAVQAALRPHGDSWSPVATLGPVDPMSFPVATQSALGQSLVGWISGGQPYASPAAPATGTFLPAVALSRTSAATALTLAFGAGKAAIAVWIQGTVDQKLVGARFRPYTTLPR